MKNKKLILAGIILAVVLIFATGGVLLASTKNSNNTIDEIYQNFLNSIDQDKYYGGAYWEGEAYLLDEKGEQLLDETGKPYKNYDRNFHILVTDLKIVPKNLNNPKIFFHKVKYSETELVNFIDIIYEKFADEGLASVGLRTLENKIEITLLEGFDINKFDGIIPKDAYYISFVNEPILIK